MMNEYSNGYIDTQGTSFYVVCDPAMESILLTFYGYSYTNTPQTFRLNEKQVEFLQEALTKIIKKSNL